MRPSWHPGSRNEAGPWHPTFSGAAPWCAGPVSVCVPVVHTIAWGVLDKSAALRRRLGAHIRRQRKDGPHHAGGLIDCCYFRPGSGGVYRILPSLHTNTGLVQVLGTVLVNSSAAGACNVRTAAMAYLRAALWLVQTRRKRLNRLSGAAKRYPDIPDTPEQCIRRSPVACLA